jgi:phosphoglycolate phosphatase-like HAD superfamily hydrolase/GNAT superfamily N-acetyltransferase
VLLIFDLDGTLIDSKNCIVKATQEAFNLQGLPAPSEDQIVEKMGIPIEVTFPEWSGWTDAQPIIDSYRSLYGEISKTELKPFKGIHHALTFLAKDHTLAIATSKKRSVAEQSLEICGLRNFFPVIVGSDDVQNFKPHPETIEKVLSALKMPELRSGDIWMIGDTIVDLQMAQTLDICSCAVTWGAGHIDDLSNHDYEATSIVHLPNEFLWLFGDKVCGRFLGELSIIPWNQNHSVDRITEVLHLAYGALARQGMHYNASHQPPSQTLQRLSSGDSFVAVVDNTLQDPFIIGTISVYRSSPENHHPYYQRPGLVYFGQFAVHPDYQGYGVSKMLYQTVEDHARSISATEIALDTAETAHELIDMYRRWGFEIVDTADWDSTNYISVIMAKPI